MTESASLPPLIAIVGSDGSGKSTLGTALLDWMNESRPTRLCHLGKQTGNIGRAIGRLPLVGGRLDKTLHEKAAKATDPAGPGVVTALVIYLFSMRRVWRFKRMLALRAKGFAILTDRFPQLAVPGKVDGLGLDEAATGSGLVRWLARRERRHYEWMASHKPDLVIRLTVDLATAVARKPDHRVSSLETKIRDVERLTFGGAQIVDIDAAQPADAVLDHAKAAITGVLEQR
jgi:thymidylate kinase